jgi:hypothetical protein
MYFVQLGTDSVVVSPRGIPGLPFTWPKKLTYQSKILPLSVRAKGVSLSTATNWAFNFLVGEVTPFLQEVITWKLYPMHGFFCVCSFILGKYQFSCVE